MLILCLRTSDLHSNIPLFGIFSQGSMVRLITGAVLPGTVLPGQSVFCNAYPMSKKE